MPRERRLSADPRDWSEEERREVTSMHRVFRESAPGRVAWDVIRRDLWDIQSAVALDDKGHERLMDDRTTIFNEGLRAAYKRIEAYIDAYDYMTNHDVLGVVGTKERNDNDDSE